MYCNGIFRGSLVFLLVFSVSFVPGMSAGEHDSTAGAQADSAFDSIESELADMEGGWDANYAPVSDPLKRYNRTMFAINDRLYYWLLKPVAQGYAKIIPKPGRTAANRFFANLAFPVRAVNNALQGELKKAGIECARFGLNTSLGFAGLRDPARTRFGFEPAREDFGQTLGEWGTGAGWPIVLPVFGPSNIRDAIGKIPDYFLNPVSYIDSFALRSALRGYERANWLSLHLGEYELLTEGAMDPYIALRSAYRQNRESKILE